MEDSIIRQQTTAKPNANVSSNKGCLLALFLIFAFLLSPLVWRKAVSWYYTQHIYSPSTVPEEKVAIVFGAAVYRNGRLSSVLRDRMETAINLYERGKVQKILVSGGSANQTYDEPGAMKAYAVQRGVAEEDIQVDHAGERTYDTCYRARNIFQLDRAILVTQAFHLPRAIFTCQRLGLEANGVPADMRPYRGMRWYEFRETVATMVALLDVIRLQPPPVEGDPISWN